MNVSEKSAFSKRVLPLFLAGHVLIYFQKTDVGGAKRDSAVGHLPLIKYIAEHGNLPLPGDYHVANIPVWHFFAAFLYNISNSTFFIALFQITIAVVTLFILESILSQYVPQSVSNLLVTSIALNSYFISSSHFATTDGLAIFSFSLFLFALNKLYFYPDSFIYIVIINISLALSALNRQMFIMLFVIYAITFFRRKPISRIIVEVLPSGLIVVMGFFLFYVNYCNFLNSDVCWPVRQSRDLVFPVLVNLPVVMLLVVIFLFPILVMRETRNIKNLILGSIILVALAIFFELYGNKKIFSERNLTGGGLYKFREIFGSVSVLIDIISMTFFCIITLVVYRKNGYGSWAYQSILVFVLSSVFGPYAFQRYFEIYILILCALFLSINSGKIFSSSIISLKVWSIFLIVFQVSEYLASAFIPI